MSKKKKYYRVKKYLIEDYGVMAYSKKEAEESDLEDPSLVTVTKTVAKHDPEHDEQ